MAGTLSAALTVPPEFEHQQPGQLDTAVARLRYGVVGINQWPGVAFALMSTPWGGFPGSTLDNIQSGIGSVHNTYLLDRPEKTVLRSSLTMFPKPVWFSTHRCPEKVAKRLLDFYVRPKSWRLLPILVSAIRG